MGTIEGIQDKKGSPDLSGNVGTIKTVNGEPTVQLKGSFTGTRDDVPATAQRNSNRARKGDACAAQMALWERAVTEAKLAACRSRERTCRSRLLLRTPGPFNNLKKDWTLQLDFATKQPPKGKSYIVASAQLVLPNGDTIVFAEKRTTYNKKTGYTVSFSRGTNTTVNPQKIDTKTSISIKGMTLVKRGTGWQPTAGTLTYKFFGQKGTGNLMDFVAP